MAPIDTLPSEVLRLVFAQCDHGTRVILASTVCRKWRDAALDTPSLWNLIDLSLPDVSPDKVLPVIETTIHNAGRYGRPVSAFADLLDVDQEKSLAIADALTPLCLTTFRNLVAVEPFNINGIHGSVIQSFIGTNAASAIKPEDTGREPLGTGDELKLAWVHRARDEDPRDDFTAVDADECLSSLSPALEDAGVTRPDEWLIIHTHLNSTTGRLYSIALANWSQISWLTLTLPGTYQYLPILAQTPRLAFAWLTFQNPPIGRDDDPLSPQPFGFKGRHTIDLPHLHSLFINFIEDSFIDFPSSWHFLDSVTAGNLKGFNFTSTHLVDGPFADYEWDLFIDILAGRYTAREEILPRHIPAYHSLYTFLQHSGGSVQNGLHPIPAGLEGRSVGL